MTETPSQLVLQAREWLWPAVIVLLLGAFLSWRAGHRLPATWRGASVALRVLGFALLLLCLLEPVWSRQQPKAGANFLAVLADNSAGLSIEDADRKDSRLAQARALLGADEALGEEPAWLREVGEEFRLRRYLFGAGLSGVRDFTELDASEPASAIGSALERLSEQFDERPLAGVLLVTDGNSTDALPSPEELRRLPPVYPVVLGGAGPGKDRALGEIRVEQTVFEDAPVTIEAQVRGFGVEGQPTVVALFAPDGTELERRTVSLREGGASDKIRFRLKPDAAGIQSYELRILGDDPDEATLENNVRSVIVDRGRGPYRILYVGGRPNWEYKFLRRAAESDPELDLAALLRIALQEPKFQWTGRSAGSAANPLFQGFGGAESEEQRYDKPVLTRLQIDDPTELAGGFPKLAEDLFAPYQAIIIDDLEASFFTRDQLVLIRDFVSRRGGGFLMLGGADSLASGEYANTPVGDLLPIFAKRGVEEPGALRYALSREGWLETWVRLRDTEIEERDRLAGMPAFRVRNLSRSLKPGGSVLATTTGHDGKAVPALVVQRFGSGRSGALLIGDLWRWGMKNAAAHEDMDKAWRQILRWLVAETPRRLVIEPVTPTLGAPISLRARVANRSFQPDLEARVSLEIYDAGAGADAAPLATTIAGPSLEEPGLYEAEFHPDKTSGSYRVVAKAIDGEGKEVPTREAGGWTFHPAAEEFRDLVPNRDLLASLASATGGKVLLPSDLASLKEQLGALDAPVTETVTSPLWHTPWIFLIAVLCLLAEWWLRRMKGMP